MMYTSFFFAWPISRALTGGHNVNVSFLSVIPCPETVPQMFRIVHHTPQTNNLLLTINIAHLVLPVAQQQFSVIFFGQPSCCC